VRTKALLLAAVGMMPLAAPRAGGADVQPAIVAAARSGDLARMRALLRNEVDVNQPEADGTTALHWAVHRDDAEAIELLLGARAAVNATNRYGVFPLHLAAVNGSTPVIERLLRAGANPNSALPEGETALMTATRAGSAAAVKLLLAHGADVNAREAWKGQTALMWAAVENHADAAKALIDGGADVDAASAGGVFTAFLFAVRGGHTDVARVLLDAGVDVNAALADGTSALTLAVMNAHYELAAMLLDRGADPKSDAQGWTALHQIAWTRRPNYGYNLPGAVSTGSWDALDLVSKLVRHGADVNARQTKEPRDGNRNMLNRIGATPFLLAAKAVDLPLMRALLDVDADPSLSNADGTTPLMVAAGVGIWAPGESPGTEEEALAAVHLLLELGAGRVTDVDRNGNTALHGAVLRAGSIPLVKLLVSRGARLDVKNARGWTPLTIADGVEYTPDIFKRYPETAAVLRAMMKEQGLPVPLPAGP
jgi:ankyrin repeat protein